MKYFPFEQEARAPFTWLITLSLWQWIIQFVGFVFQDRELILHNVNNLILEMPRTFKMVSIWMVAIVEFYPNLVQTTIKFVKFIWLQFLWHTCTRDIVVIIRFFSLLMNSIPTICIVNFCKMDSLNFAIRCAMDK